MKASVRWLRELCPQLPDDAAAIAARLTAAGLEVEGATAFGAAAESCVVARVVSMRPHPSRSGLRLVTVDRGGPPLEIVCGAPNVPEPGGLVVLAPLGAILPAKGVTIERRAIGGVFSEGMLCSQAELGLGEEAEGIFVPPAAVAAPGARLVDAMPAARDTILEVGLTPNRPDGLGHVGLAREAAALFDVPFAPQAPRDPERLREDDFTKYAAVSIEDGEACPHYGAAVLLDARVAPSPIELQWRLASLGVRPISNVVDVTNLVMLELGHPMHAFDLDRVRGPSIVVRRARAGETLKTLDGVERLLADDDLVVCDAGGPVALAGVMGGAGSQIRATTRQVLVECAYFDPRAVRRSARRHGLHTESSHRFERGVDWGDTRVALARAVSYIGRLGGATAVVPARLVEARPLAKRSVQLRHARLEAVLGAPVERAEARAILERLGFAGRALQPASDTWEVPSFRPDVSREVDLIEEVARVRGYDRIPTTLPAIRASADAAPRQRMARRARRAAIAVGLSEAVTAAFVRAQDLAAVGAAPAAVTLRNPLGDERSVMRTSLLPGLLHALARAHRHGEKSARLFTVGAIFLPADPMVPERATGPRLPEERLMLTAVLAGERGGWLSKPQPFDVWDAKGLAEAMVTRLVRRSCDVRLWEGEARPSMLHPRGGASIEVAGRPVGLLGPLHPDVGDAFDLSAAVAVVEIDLSALDSIGAEPIRFAALPRFPASTRDLSLVVANAVPAGRVEEAVRRAAGDLAEEVVLFDRFAGGSVPLGHSSLALHVVYRALDRTLTDAEVDARHAEVVAAVEKSFAATLRT